MASLDYGTGRGAERAFLGGGRGSTQFVSARGAAAYLGVSVSFFRCRVANEVPCVDFADRTARKRLPRWRVADLDRWASSRTAA